MRIAINENWVQKQTGAARNSTNLGVFLMLIAMAMSFSARLVLYAYISLFISVPMLRWGLNRTERWLRKPRPDEALAKSLKGMDNSYQLFLFNLPAEHVLLAPTGVFVLNLKIQDGQISVHGDKWHRKFTAIRLLRLLFEEWLGNPTKEAQAAAEKLGRAINKRLPDLDVTPQPVVVFVNPGAKLEVENPTMPVTTLGDLKTYLRSVTSELPQETYKALSQVFHEQAG